MYGSVKSDDDRRCKTDGEEKGMNGCRDKMFCVVKVNGFVMPLTED